MIKFILDKLKDNSGVVTEAVIAACLGTIILIVLTTNIVVSNDINMYDISNGCVEYIRWSRPDIYRETQKALERKPTYEEAVINGSTKEVLKFFFEAGLMKDIIQVVHEYLSTLGEFTSTGYTFQPPSSGVDVSKADLQQHFVDFASSYTWSYGFNWSSIFDDQVFYMSMDSGVYPYVSFIRATGFSGDDFIIVSSSREQFLGSPVSFTSTGFSGSGWRVLGWRQGQTNASPWIFNQSYTFDQFTSFTVIGQYHYDDSAVAPAPVSMPYTSTGVDFGLNPTEYADTVVDDAEGLTIYHYPDGATDTREGVGVSIPILGYDEDGNPIFDIDSARYFDLGDALDKPEDDVYEPSDAEIPDGSVSVQSRVLSFLSDFWKSFVDKIVDALKRFFLPNEDDTKRMIADIRQAFEDKFGYTGFDFDSIFGEAYEPQDFYLTNYSAGGLPVVSQKIVDVSFLKTAVLKFRSLMRAVISLLLLLYNLNQLFNFLGFAGVSLGMWHPIDGDEKPEYIKGFFSRGGKFRGE